MKRNNGDAARARRAGGHRDGCGRPRQVFRRAAHQTRSRRYGCWISDNASKEGASQGMEAMACVGRSPVAAGAGESGRIKIAELSNSAIIPIRHG